MCFRVLKSNPRQSFQKLYKPGMTEKSGSDSIEPFNGFPKELPTPGPYTGSQFLRHHHNEISVAPPQAKRRSRYASATRWRRVGAVFTKRSMVRRASQSASSRASSFVSPASLREFPSFKVCDSSRLVRMYSPVHLRRAYREFNIDSAIIVVRHLRSR
jgi:hypothetical protein